MDFMEEYMEDVGDMTSGECGFLMHTSWSYDHPGVVDHSLHGRTFSTTTEEQERVYQDREYRRKLMFKMSARMVKEMAEALWPELKDKLELPE
jgi:hypothetical protein